MTSKIALVIIVTLSIAIIAPTAYAELNPTDQRWKTVCNNKATDGKFSFADFSCAVNIYKMYHDIITLFENADTLNDQVTDMNHRLQVLEGAVPPPEAGDPLVVFVTPDTISKGESFTVYGHVDRIEQNWVDFAIYDSAGERVQSFDIVTLQNGGFYPPAIMPNNNWIVNGTYLIIATHGPHTEIVTIEYLG